METYIREEKTYMDGMPCPFLCHLQTAEGEGSVYPAHYHSYIEMLFGLSGEFQIYLNGSWHGWKAGDLVLISAEEVHHIYARSEEGGSYIVVRFMPEFLQGDLTGTGIEKGYLRPLLSPDGLQEKVISQEELTGSGIGMLFQKILKETGEREYAYELAVRNHILGICLWIIRYWHRKNPELFDDTVGNRELFRALEPALAYMDEHFRQNISVCYLAELCGFSYSYFSRSFQRLMHRKIPDYLNSLRVAEAEKLLISTSMTVTEIALATGFGTSSYFIKIFRRYKHLSPRQFRAMLSENA